MKVYFVATFSCSLFVVLLGGCSSGFGRTETFYAVRTQTLSAQVNKHSAESERSAQAARMYHARILEILNDLEAQENASQKSRLRIEAVAKQYGIKVDAKPQAELPEVDQKTDIREGK